MSNSRQRKTIDRDVCGGWLRVILARDGWKFGVSSDGKDAVFVAGKDDRALEFFFLDQGPKLLTAALRRIARQDGAAFKRVGVVIASTAQDVERARAVNKADAFPRAFFTSMDDLRAVAEGSFLPVPKRPGNILAFPAQVTANRQIGGADSSHYILRFRAPEIQEVWASQFVMMDVTTARPLLGGRRVQRGGWRDAVDLPPLPILKRPFGIQRSYYRHFNPLYLKNLALPPTLALGLYTVHPHEFDLFYKVLADGAGTPLMTRLAKGDKVHMVGPLGTPFDVRTLRAAGVAEVHLVGGGVGVAPLILLAQVLRFYSFRVKVFIGMSKLGLLRYKGDVDTSFEDEPGEAYVYIDDLLEAGVSPTDIFLACDSEPPDRVVRRMPKGNFYHGLVPAQYRQYLKTQPMPGPVTVFSCGPDRMMEAMHGVAREAGVTLKLLMEKRMGCGFGVCLSCVVRVRDGSGGETYARVCTEGPVFDAEDILWNQNDSKSESATCGCARP